MRFLFHAWGEGGGRMSKLADIDEARRKREERRQEDAKQELLARILRRVKHFSS